MTDAEAMNSVPEKNYGGWYSILTKTVMAGIPVLVQQGMAAEAIAAQIGGTVGTLRVRCCHAGISLRVPKEATRAPKLSLVSLVPVSS